MRVFSWGEGVALKNIETLVLTKGISNSLLPEIEEEIKTGFTRADFKKFNYIKIEVPMSYVWWYLLIMVLTQGGFWAFAHFNTWDKLMNNGRFRY